MTMRNTIEYVREIIESKGGELLSTTYINNKQLLTVKFSDGEIEERTFNGILHQDKIISKKQRSKNTTKRQLRSIDEIKKLIEDRGGKLLSTEYTSRYEPLLIQTSDNVIESRAMDSIVQCTKLISKNKVYQQMGVKQQLSMAEIKKIVEDKGGKLLSENVEYLNNRSYINIKCSCGREISNCIFNIQQNYKIITCSDCRPKSQFENEVFDFLKSIYAGEILRNDKFVVYPQELDFVIPDKNICIECNGIYWHSETIKPDKYYHVKKTKLAKEAGYDLIHISDSEWELKKDIIKDLISKRLGIIETKIHGRKCKLVALTSKETQIFLDENHLQGNIPAKYKYGLMYNDILVSVMTCSKPRFKNNVDFELYRFANKLGTIVVGGFSKLFNHFLREINPQSVISYCDISHFSGNVYTANNFELVNESHPNYKYFTKRNYILYSRNMFQKHKLDNLLDDFNPTLTEYENMKNNGYHRIWDCGNFVYIFKN